MQTFARRTAAVVLCLLATLPPARLVAQSGRDSVDAGDAGDAGESVSADTTARHRGRGRDRRVRVSGFVQVFYRASRDADGSGRTAPSLFRAQRVRLTFQGDVNRHVGYEIDVDPRAPQVTGILRDAFIRLDYLPRHEIRVGQQKTQFGRENVVSSRQLFFVNRAEVSDNLARGVNLRDLGLGIVGSLPLSRRFRLEEALTLVNGAGINAQADDTPRKNLWGRVGIRFRDAGTTVRVGVSGARGDQLEVADPGPPAVDSFTIDFTRLGADVQVDHRRLFAAVEFVSTDDRVRAGLDAGGSANGYYGLVAVKTRWNAGPLLRYDFLDGYARWTAGAYLGLPTDEASLLLNYEVARDDVAKSDDRLYLRLQVRF